MKSFLVNRKYGALELESSLAQNWAENFSNVPSCMRVIYGFAGLIGLSFVSVASGVALSFKLEIALAIVDRLTHSPLCQYDLLHLPPIVQRATR